MSQSRRNFFRRTAGGLLIAPAAAAISSCGNSKATTVNGYTAPLETGKKVTLSITDFGAKPDGQMKNTFAIQQAIDRCSVLGGGTVAIPAGNWLTGAIALKSNVLIHLEKDAILTGSPDFADYPVHQVRWEGKWIAGHVGLIYAFDAHNIGITGPGKIIGSHALGGRPNDKNPYRHPALIEPIGCTNLRFEDFSTDYYLMWSMHPTNCQNLLFKNLYIRSTGGNGDGIDIDSCKHVTIDGCDISTGDDCISLKSGRGMEGYTLLNTTEDVSITNCTFADSIFACIGIGSETSGGIRNVLIEKCKFTAAKTHAIYIKSRPGRGAFIENIRVNDIDVAGTEGGFLRFNILGSGLQDQVPVPGLDGIPTIKDFHFSNVRVTDVPVLVEGTAIHPEKPLQGFSLTNVSGTCKQGISLANINGAKLGNINVTGFTGPLLRTYNVSGKGLDGAVAIDAPKPPAAIGEPAVKYELK